MLMQFSLPSFLPTCLDYAGHFAAQREVAQLVAPEAELAVHAARPTGHRTAVAQPHRTCVTGQPLQLRARGIPRLVNQICDYALVYAFTDGLDKVDAGVIEQVVTDRRMHGNLKMVAG
jgi:hypothetical protein